MMEPNPYEPPRSEPPHRRGMGSIGWIFVWFVFGVVFCVLFVPAGDPFTSACIMGFGAGSFALGNLFARARSGPAAEGDMSHG